MLQDSQTARERAQQELAKRESANDETPHHQEDLKLKAEAARQNDKTELAKLEH